MYLFVIFRGYLYPVSPNLSQWNLCVSGFSLMYSSIATKSKTYTVLVQKKHYLIKNGNIRRLQTKSNYLTNSQFSLFRPHANSAFEFHLWTPFTTTRKNAGLYKRETNRHREKKWEDEFLFRKIQELDQQTSPKGIPEKRELIEKKGELAALLEQESKHAFHIVMKERYQLGSQLP